MRVVENVPTMQRLAMRWRQRATKVALVPTMGALHAGHESLVRLARKLVGKRGVVVVSIYVNPTQFSPTEDLKRYPRNFQGDRRLCRGAGADVIFFPSDEEMYAGRSTGHYSTYVVEESLSRTMEGESRPTHFRGVTTVVAKLFNVVLPDLAIFGAKDFQQATVVQRMVNDLNFPVKVVVAPTVRELDGLAMSSRNQYLTGAERQQATSLWQAIQRAKNAVRRSPGMRAERLGRELQTFIEKQPAARVDYIQFFDPETLEPAKILSRGVHMALAVFIGKTRLIDNARL